MKSSSGGTTLGCSTSETDSEDNLSKTEKEEEPESQKETPVVSDEVNEDPYLVFKPTDWPEELNFRTLFESIEPKEYPECYKKNTAKEEKLIRFLINFREQYKHKFNDRVVPFLLPVNECDVVKFVCTYISPVKLEHCEVYNYEGIAKFVSDFLLYVPLIPQTEYPARLLSPSTVIKKQKGTSFEYSTVLCCLLIGAGYDAYIINGFATRETCYLDRKLTNCPFVDIKNDEKETEKQKNRKIYEIKPARDYRSKFELFLSARKVIDEKDAIEKERLAKLEQERVEDIPPPDRLFGLRIHSWVLVKKGKRLIEESFFIEPTTGLTHPLQGQNLYNGIESAWNNKNYWVNMQDCTAGLDNLDYDFENENLWEHILPDDTEGDLKIHSNNKSFLARVSLEDISDGDVQQMKMNQLKDEHNMAMKRPDMTVSWTIPMKIDRRTFESQYPNHQKRTYYKRIIVDHFAEYFLGDGLIMRLEIYSDREYTDLLEVKEIYRSRKDKLVEKTLDVKSGWVTEIFGPGRSFQMNKHVYLDQSPDPQQKRQIYYYHNIRADGLERREETETSITEHYVDRYDRLCYRHAEFEPITEEDPAVETVRENDLLAPPKKEIKISFKSDGSDELGTGPRKIIRIVQKYTRNEEVAADEDVEEEDFRIKEDRIRVTYHRDADDVTAGMREYTKPFIPEDQIQKLKLEDETHYSFTVNQFKPQLKKVQIFQMMLDLFQKEAKAIDAVRWAENETRNIWRTRNTEQEELKLEISMFDCLRNEETKERRAEMIRMEEEERERNRQLSLDYLAPFMAQIGFLKVLSWEQACKLREDCLDDFKQRLIDKANLIHERLSKETKTLQQKQQWYMENRMDMAEEDEDEYVKFCNNSAFLITTLQLMLTRHKQSAPLKYIDLERRIRKDKRLGILFHGRISVF